MIKKNLVFNEKDKDFLPTDLENIKQLLSFGLYLNSDIKLKGSASIKSQINYADYDFLTLIKINNVSDFKRFRINLLSNIDLLVNKYESIITDIKFGIDQYKYFTDKNEYTGKDKIIKINQFILNNKYYLDNEKKDLQILYNNIDYNNIISVDEYLDYYRKCYTLRWDTDEIKKGYKILHTINKKYFIECFTDPVIFKIDLLSQLRSGIKEISNIILFEYKNKIINAPQNITKDDDSGLKNDLTFYYKSGSYYKALKRLFALLKLQNKIELGNKLTNLFNSSIGLLYKLSSMLKLLLDYNIKLKKENIVFELDKIKKEINNVWGLDDPFFYTITQKLEAIKNKPFNNTININNIIKQMDKIINEISHDYIKEEELNNIIDNNLLNVESYINTFF